MALPKLSVPTYELTIPSTGAKVSYRPFLVKEEKLLLMASEGDDEKAMTKALLQIITNCIDDEIDINKLTIYDVEYVFLQLRSRSIGEISDLRYICQNVKDKKTDKKCGTNIQAKVDLSTIEVTKNDKHNPHITLVGDIGLVMKDPDVSLLNKHALSEITSGTQIFEIIADCIEYVYEGEQTFKPADCKPGEIDSFIGTLTQKQFEGIKTFFDTMPKLEYELNLECTKCKHKSKVQLNGLNDFFM